MRLALMVALLAGSGVCSSPDFVPPPPWQEIGRLPDGMTCYRSGASGPFALRVPGETGSMMCPVQSCHHVGDRWPDKWRPLITRDCIASDGRIVPPSSLVRMGATPEAP